MPRTTSALTATPILVLVLVPVLALAAPAHRSSRRANPRTGLAGAPFAELVKAAQKNDRATLERLASRMGPGRLAEAVRSADAKVAEAALIAIPLSRGRVVLAGVVAERLESPDAALATAASRALGDLLDGSAPAELDEWEVPPDAVARACGGLRALAARLEAPAPSRLAALDALAAAQRVCTATAELAPLLRDPVPAVRRAAALLLRPQERPVAAALRDVIRDPDPTVASAAVAAVCRAEAGVPAHKSDPLVEQSTAAARTLAGAAGTPPEDAVEMLACVAAAGTPADRSLLDRLRRGPPSALRDRASELAESGARVKPE